MKTTSPVVFFLIAATVFFGCLGNVSQPASNDNLNRASLDNPDSLQDESKTTNKLQTQSSKEHGDKSTEKVDSTKRSLDEMLLFFPSQHPSGNWNPSGLKFEDVWIASNDGTRLHGWYCPCEKPNAYILYAHGNAGNLSDRADLLKHLQTKLNVTSLIFDYRGYGQSDGRPTVAGAIDDTRAAAKFLAKRAGVKESELVLMGRSLGGAMVVQIAADVNPKGLILESTFSSLKKIAKHHYPKLAWLVPSKKLNSLQKIRSYSGPLLQSHGSHDRTIPYDSARELFEAAQTPKSFFKVENCDHNDPQPETYYMALSEFLSTLPTVNQSKSQQSKRP